MKQLGANGEISPGKEFAGQPVQIEQSEPVVWLMRTVVVIPANELWLHILEYRASLERAFSWAKESSPEASDPDYIFGNERNGKLSQRSVRWLPLAPSSIAVTNLFC